MSDSLVDSAQLEVIAGGMPEMLLEVLSDFKEDFRTQQKELLEKGGEATADEWRDYFHRIKGSGGTLGLTALYEESAKLEESARGGAIPQPKELENFTELFEKSSKKAQEFLEGLGG